MNKPVISIVMPMFNSVAHVNNSIQSILAQTFQDFELLIIDDGSEDSSVELVSKIKDSRIKLLQNKHDFIGSLNMGLNLAQGEYIARMDSDDVMLPNRLEVQYKFMEENPEIDEDSRVFMEKLNVLQGASIISNKSFFHILYILYNDSLS